MLLGYAAPTGNSKKYTKSTKVTTEPDDNSELRKKQLRSISTYIHRLVLKNRQEIFVPVVSD